mmetsp:Transcript_16816/g.30442  ORF Transcript_16816/g.30442 Transcript_16816/m.30442 type:complete len:99 (-) Transcript_16816:1033-1329(-)
MAASPYDPASALPIARIVFSACSVIFLALIMTSVSSFRGTALHALSIFLHVITSGWTPMDFIRLHKVLIRLYLSPPEKELSGAFMIANITLLKAPVEG